MSALADDAPRGFVPMRDYLKLQRRVDELEAQLADRKQDERQAQDEDLILMLRVRLRISKQEASVLALLANRSKPAQAITIAETLDMPDRHQPAVVICRLNGKIRDSGGPPYTARGFYGPGGAFAITDQGRAWLQERVPELFAKGASR